jgi:hypothetical protein
MLICGAAGTSYYTNDLSAASFMAAMPGSGCNIKGNISIEIVNYCKRSSVPRRL